MDFFFTVVPILDALLRMSVESMTTSVGTIATAWQSAPMEFRQGVVTDEQRVLRPLVLILMAASVVVGGARMAWDRDAEPGRRLLRSLLTAAIVTGGSAAIVVTAVNASDALALALCPPSEVERLGAMLEASADTELKKAGTKFVLLIMTTFVALSSLIQTIILFLRSAGLTALAVVLPAAAAFTSTDLGRAWFQKSCSWILALVLYKPAAALLYKIALALMTSAQASSDARAAQENAPEFDLYGFLLGVTMMLLAIVALPALLKLITPAVGAMAGGGLSLRPPPVGGAMPTGAASAGGGRSASAWSAQPSPGGARGDHGAAGLPGPTGGTASGPSQSGSGAHSAGAGAAAGGGAPGGAPGAASSQAAAAGAGAAQAGTVAASGGTLAAAQVAGAALTRAAQTAHGVAQAAGHTATTAGPEGSAG